MDPQNAALYCRLSYAPDGSLEKVERQEADGRDLAARINWRVGDVYCDNSRSAWQRNRKRPAWDQMLLDIRAGLRDGIIVYHGDRLIRQPWDLELLLQLADDRRLPLASVSGTRDLSSSDDRFILRIEAAQACKASDDTSRRVLRGLQARAERGHAQVGSRRPFGFGAPTGDTGSTGKPLFDVSRHVPDEVKVIREATDRLLAGQSLGGVVAWMNTVSTTTEGNRWQPAAVKRLLLSPRVAGLVEYRGSLHPAAWEPIVTPVQQEDLRADLRRKAKRHGYHGRARRYLLSGVAECSGCDHPVGVKRTNGRLQYYCRNPECPVSLSRKIDLVDEYVIGRVLRRLSEPGFVEALHAERADPDVSAEIVALELRKQSVSDQLADLADFPELDAGLLVRSLASFDRKIAELRGRQETSARQRLLLKMAGMTRVAWDAEPVDVRSETVRMLFRVALLPPGRGARRFDPATVRVRRR